MDDGEQDRVVRGAIARSLTERGTIPTIANVAAAIGSDVATAEESFCRLQDAHVFIPREGSNEIYAYDPFCIGPTDFRITAAGRDWWAICAWDALGVPPALGATGTIVARCADCGDPITIEVGLRGSAAAHDGAVLQIGVPAREFWKDIRFT